MPTTYTHYRFGHDVESRLAPRYHSVIESYQELFDAGLHGPDLLFYYHALSSNDVIRLGNELHTKSGRSFFERAGEIVKESPCGAHIAYVFGFLCHFALDRTAHAYIEKFIEETGVSHFAIEAELDRYFLLKDGKDPFHGRLTQHIVPRDRNARVIADFFPPATPVPTENGLVITPEIIRTAMQEFIRYLDLLICGSNVKRNFLYKTLDLAHHEGFKDLIISEEPIPACEKSNQDLDRIYEASIDDAVRLIQEFPGTIAGKRPWNELYSYNFEGERLSD
ncbi:MAG: zinc dependent phospholipase C family protein [Firmicutes bacterium]|nr:zinc dependent phospholipase C family protein [Bacillota bacterium]